MTTLAPEKTVGQYVADQPSLARVFERLGIDYCCGGKKPLAQACAERGLNADSVLKTLLACDNGKGSDDHGNWALTTLGQLVDHIVTEHHGFLRAELPRLDAMIAKVVNAHGAREPHLADLHRTFSACRAELEQHMIKEEQILFPMIRQLEVARKRPEFHCGSVENPIRVMVMEHDSVGDALSRMREMTHDYTAPEEACNTYRAMLDGLRELEQDTHRHVHEENNILFPKAVKIESSLA